MRGGRGWVRILADATSTRSILTGFDMDARPILYMRPGRENTETSPRQIRHLIYHLYVLFYSPSTLGVKQTCLLTDIVVNEQST